MTNIHRLSPLPEASLIEENEVTVPRLCSLLTGAVIENTVDEDGHIYASDGLEFPLWIEVDKERSLLCFFTYLSLDDDWSKDLPQSRLLEKINNLNSSIVLVQFSLVDDRIFGKFWMTFDAHLDPRQFIKMLRRFSSAFHGGLDDLYTTVTSEKAGPGVQS